MPDTTIEGFQLSPQQQHLWSLAHHDRRLPYIAQSAILLEGPLDPARLRAALGRVVDLHEILRTTFRLLPGMPVPLQVIDDARIAWEADHDLSDLDARAQAAAFDQLFDDGYRQPIDSELGPALHAALVTLAHDRHALLVRLPAMCADRRTLTNLTAQLCAAYQGPDQDGLDEPIQYVMVSDWLNELLESEQAELGKKYWRQKASAAAPAGKLPFERAAGPIAASSLVLHIFPPNLGDALEALARAHATTIDVALLTCWHVLLWRLTGCAGVVVGTAFDGRTDEELAGTLGLFTKYLPVCSRPAGDTHFGDLLRQIAQGSKDAAAWQECFTWADFVAAQPAGTTAPFFAFCFDFERHDECYAAHGLVFSSYRQRAATERFQVKLACARTASGVEALFDYDPHLFAPADIERLSRQFATLAGAAARDPGSRISALEILDAAERHQLLATFNPPAAHPPNERCLPELFEEQVARTPDAVAVVFDRPTTNDQRRMTTDRPSPVHPFTPSPLHPFTPSPLHPFTCQHLTYQELNRRANQLAHYLRLLGVGPEVFVGLYLERSIEMIVGLLAVLKAGGVYAPLDPDSPRERLELILGQLQARVILTRQSLAAGLPSGTAQLVCLDIEESLDDRAGNVAGGIAPQNLAYVIFTSGSTGLPKGVLVSHAALSGHCLAARTRYAFTPDDRVLQFAVFHFDASLEQILPPLLSGASVVLRGNEVWDAARCAAEIAGQRLSVINLPTAYWHQITAEWAAASAPPRDHRLRLVIVGGEAMQPEYAHVWERMFGAGVHLLNAYGPTEATITATLCPVVGPASDGALEQEAPIGRALGDRTAHILDPYGNLAPIGVVGELYLGGASLARGYLNQPALTAERFIPNPFAGGMGDGGWGMVASPPSPIPHPPSPGTRLYKTGDLVRWRSDGAIEFVGRADYQIKLRGFRIELAEIEAALGRHPAVREAVVLAREDVPGDVRLVAYVVPKIEDRGLKIEDSGSDAPALLSSILYPLSSELRRFLQTRLPDYMVPGDFVFLDSFPITTSGKIDRRALPDPATLEAAPQHAYVAPRTPVEEALAEIWADVFKRAQVGVFDNFFDLGGHSLIATQLVARVRAVFQAEVSLRSLLAAPTVAGLAHTVEQALREARGLAAPPLLPTTRDGGHWLLSFAQQRLWFLQQFEPQSPAYNMPGLIRIRGALDSAALARSLTEITWRHEALRTTFAMADGQPVQVIAPPAPHAMPEEDLRTLPADEREATLARLAGAEAYLPFDLARGPLLRTLLLRLDEAEYALLLTMHHIVADEWSVNLLVQELTALYETFVSGKAARLPELPLQYVDFALWQREWLQGAALDAQLAYWKAHLAGAPALLALPTDRPRPASQTFNGASRSFSLAAPLSDALRNLSRREETTLFMTLMAAFQVLLARFSGHDDIVVGSPIAGRTRAEIEGLIGCFINTLALRADLSGEPTFREALARVREVTLAAYAHQDVPFEKLVEELQPARDLSHAPLFQVMFTLQHRPVTRFALRDLDLSLSEIENNTTKFDLTLFMAEGDTLSGTLEYNTDLFASVTIERLIERFQLLLAGVVADPEQPIGQISLLSEAERRMLLVDWNATSAPLPPLCLHDLFEAQAARTPDAVAVVFHRGQGSGVRGQEATPLPPPAGGGTEGGRVWASAALSPQSSVLSPQSLAYRELNDRANRLAHVLQARGVGPDTLVAVMMERGVELLVALLGVLKAGGAYVPLDPALPPARLAFMLQDARATLVLTTTDHRPPTNDQRPTTDHRPTTNDDRSAMTADASAIVADASAIVADASAMAADASVMAADASETSTARRPTLRLRSGQATEDPRPTTAIQNPKSKIVNLDAEWPSIAQAPALAPSSGVAADNLAYVIYTSGSTGVPKGVAVSHANLVNLVTWHQRVYGVTAEDRASQLAGLGFDAAVWEIWPYLLAGACLHLPDEDTRAEVPRLLAWLTEQRITISFMPTPLAEAALAQAWPHESALRLLLTGGDVLHRGPSAAHPFTLVNNYGPTENTVVATWAVVPPDVSGAPPIGRPVDQVQLYILDRYLQPAPLGMPGELYIGGAGLARCYLNRSDLTAERFIPNPFGGVLGVGCWVLEDSASVTQHPTPNTRLYRTGDLARYRPDGAIEYLGRADDQVKVRGFRIEPGEIEATLLQHPAVSAAAVLAREDAPGERRLVAYVVSRIEDRGLKIEDSSSDAPDPLSSILYPLSSELRDFLKNKLPDYMLPSAFVVLEALPLTPNGKLDRRALPAPDAVRPELDTRFVAPRTPVEVELARIWAEVLGIAEIGVYDNFFDLGGHSLKVVQVLSRVGDAFQVDMSLHSLFRAPIIADFAREIEQTTTRPAALPAIKPLARQPRHARDDLNLAEAAETDAVKR